MSGYDLFLSPAMECVAFEHGRTGPATIGGEPIGDFYDFCHFCYPSNLTGQPAISVPMGAAEHGLPVGLQIVGRRFEHALVLRAGAAWQRLTGWDRASLKPRAAHASAGAFAELASGERSFRLAPGDPDVAAGERIRI
jgi:Asp-tRNA(Asn)/Glu-tRNA(Gln) amidotransferase A subunit family amidase